MPPRQERHLLSSVLCLFPFVPGLSPRGSAGLTSLSSHWVPLGR